MMDNIIAFKLKSLIDIVYDIMQEMEGVNVLHVQLSQVHTKRVSTCFSYRWKTECIC